jgi:hypothetical protein
MSRLGWLFVCVSFSFCAAQAEESAPKPATGDQAPAAKPDPEQIKALFAKLGHEDFEEREKATVALIDMGPAIKDDLAKLEAETKDAEVTHRCAGIREAWADLEQTGLGVLRYIEKSGGTFYRPGGRRTNYDGPKFSAHLRAKAVLNSVSLTVSAKEFIAKVATTSSLHGTAYWVALPDGTELELREWLAKKYRLE